MTNSREPETEKLFDLEYEDGVDRPSVFTESGAYLNDAALKAFLDGMKKDVEPTPALIETMRRAKSIRQA